MAELLSSCTSGGCGAKIGPGELSGLLAGLKGADSDRLLVGFSGSDDAAVYQISRDMALVSAVDFFSPMVNDPFMFGKIAAANALSDVYAMGGEPLFALNLVCFPEKMDKAILSEILAGGAEKLREAGAALAGGHSIFDHEIKYGLAVTGQVHPDKLLRNNTCRPGDKLILTKALGTGVVMAANRVELARKEHVDAAIDSMQRLNKYAAEAADHAPNACTDVTGFGLLAHLCEMAGENVTVRIYHGALPLLPGSYDYAAEFLLTAGGQRNRHFVEPKLNIAEFEAVDFPLQELMLDPQTSGGLLLSVSEDRACEMLAKIHESDPAAAIIGEILPRREHVIIFGKDPAI